MVKSTASMAIIAIDDSMAIDARVLRFVPEALPLRGRPAAFRSSICAEADFCMRAVAERPVLRMAATTQRFARGALHGTAGSGADFEITFHPKRPTALREEFQGTVARIESRHEERPEKDALSTTGEPFGARGE